MSVFKLGYPSGFDDDGNPLFDIFHLPFDGDEAFTMRYGLLNTEYEFPKVLIAFGNRGELVRKKLLISFFSNYVWKKEVLNTLLKVSDFEYKYLPLHIFDVELYEWGCLNNYQLLPDYAEANTDFGYVSFLRQENMLDCFDFEKSEYSPPRRPGGFLRRIKKVVFHKQQFPAVFRDKNASGVFISQEAKDALEANDIYLPLTEIEVS